MTSPIATLDRLSDLLASVDSALPVHFRTARGDAGPGYHITELMLADVSSIDCGGATGGWREARLQLLDGRQGEPQSAGKMASILARSRAALPALGGLPLVVEFGHGNVGLSVYHLGRPVAEADRLTLVLEEGRAICKATRRAQPATATAAGCCGMGAVSACCA